MDHHPQPDMNHPLVQAVLQAYQSEQEDEALDPIVGVNRSRHPIGRMEGGDYVIFYDIRGEREIQLTESLTESAFSRFPVKPDTLLNFVTMIEYSRDLKVRVAYPPSGRIQNTLTEVMSREGLGVCKIAESEKAVHVGYFMNGKNEQPFPHETRIVIPSPEGITCYSSCPEMSAAGVSAAVLEKLNDPEYPLVIANLANVDVVGHIENRAAVLRAVSCVDEQLGKIAKACRRQGITLLVTADHGTVEEWLYPDGQVNTGHTENEVPFLLLDFSKQGKAEIRLRSRGELGDIAPTILELLGLSIPEEMTGRSLLKEPGEHRQCRPQVLLLILDGWGLRDDPSGNLIQEAETPNFDHYWKHYPKARLAASGEAVGMPRGTVGNSESGHLHMGAGRRILLDRVRIDRAIEDGSFFQNEAFRWAMEKAKAQKRALHLLGIVSHYSSHGTIDHLFALLKMASTYNLNNVFVHSLIGRRGEKPESGAVYLAKVGEMCRELNTGKLVTAMGRFWALDREENWDRIEIAYRALVGGEGTQVELG